MPADSNSNHMKLSDYVAQFLAAQGIRHVFAISGGASVHLIDSLSKRDDITYVCPHHEQGGAMAADGYARASGGLGAAVATSGPGATNMITGICSAYYDSVPVLFITGQVARFRISDDFGVRQFGFQETATVPMCTPVTKYAVRVDDPADIRYELEKAAHIATSGRPGPVVIDLPDDLQREMIEPELLRKFNPQDLPGGGLSRPVNETDIDRVLALLSEAERPVLILGWGVRLAGAADTAVEIIERLGVPVVPSWGVRDLIPEDHPLAVGAFGTHGTHYGNLTVQNADLLIAVGCRLDTHETGSPPNSFAREAKKIVVDVDSAELEKFPRFGVELDLPVEADAGDFLRSLLARLTTKSTFRRDAWLSRIAGWKTQFPICPAAYYEETAVNPYVFVNELGKAAKPGDILYMDTGCAVAWMMQAFPFKAKQRAFHAFNNTPMGCALPGAIGASLALDHAPVICVVGDGSMQMNIQELATVAHHRLPIKIFLVNNHGYSMIQQTQDQWLGSRYAGSSAEGGLSFPDFQKVAEAYGIPATSVDLNTDVADRIREVLAAPGPMLCNIEIARDHRVIPQVKFGRPIEDPEPLIDRDAFKNAMIVPYLPASETM